MLAPTCDAGSAAYECIDNKRLVHRLLQRFQVVAAQKTEL
jgi:hypothetical protein